MKDKTKKPQGKHNKNHKWEKIHNLEYCVDCEGIIKEEPQGKKETIEFRLKRLEDIMLPKHLWTIGTKWSPPSRKEQEKMFKAIFVEPQPECSCHFCHGCTSPIDIECFFSCKHCQPPKEKSFLSYPHKCGSYCKDDFHMEYKESPKESCRIGHPIGQPCDKCDKKENWRDELRIYLDDEIENMEGYSGKKLYSDELFERLFNGLQAIIAKQVKEAKREEQEKFSNWLSTVAWIKYKEDSE